MNDDRKEKLVRIMAEEFTAVEFNLYLDTHPHDRRALEDFNETVQRLHHLKREYVEEYGPLTNFGYDCSRYPWQWIEEPWPWQVNFCRRGER